MFSSVFFKRKLFTSDDKAKLVFLPLNHKSYLHSESFSLLRKAKTNVIICEIWIILQTYHRLACKLKICLTRNFYFTKCQTVFILSWNITNEELSKIECYFRRKKLKLEKHMPRDILIYSKLSVWFNLILVALLLTFNRSPPELWAFWNSFVFPAGGEINAPVNTGVLWHDWEKYWNN